MYELVPRGILNYQSHLSSNGNMVTTTHNISGISWCLPICIPTSISIFVWNLTQLGQLHLKGTQQVVQLW